MLCTRAVAAISASRYESYKQAKEPAVVPEPKQEQVLEKGPEKALEKDLEIERGHGLVWDGRLGR